MAHSEAFARFVGQITGCEESLKPPYAFGSILAASQRVLLRSEQFHNFWQPRLYVCGAQCYRSFDRLPEAPP